jgi:hypothetical protein
VGGHVVENDVDVEVGRSLLVDEVEKLAELDGAMAGGESGDDVPCCDVEGGVEVGCAVALVVVALLRRVAFDR